MFAAIPAVAEDSDAAPATYDAAKFIEDVGHGTVTVSSSDMIVTLNSSKNNEYTAISLTNATNFVLDTGVTAGTLTIAYTAGASGQSILNPNGQTLTIADGLTVIMKLDTASASFEGLHTIGNGSMSATGNVIVKGTLVINEAAAVQGTAVAGNGSDNLITLTGGDLTVNNSNGFHNVKMNVDATSTITINEPNTPAVYSLRGTFAGDITVKGAGSTAKTGDIWFYADTSISGTVKTDGIIGIYQEHANGGDGIELTGTIDAAKIGIANTGAGSEALFNGTGSITTGEIMNNLDTLFLKGADGSKTSQTPIIALSGVIVTSNSTLTIDSGVKFTGTVAFGTEVAQLTKITAGTSGLVFSEGSVEISGTMTVDEVDAAITAASGEDVVLKNLTITKGATTDSLSVSRVKVEGKVTVKDGVTLAATDVTIDPKGTLAVEGKITGSIENNGTIAVMKETADIEGAVVSGSGNVDTSAVASEGTISGSFDTNTKFTQNQVITVTGDVTLVKGTSFIFEGKLIIPEGMKFIVEDGAQLIVDKISGSIENNGTIIIESKGKATAFETYKNDGFLVTGGSKVINNGAIVLDYTPTTPVIGSGNTLTIMANATFENKGTFTIGEDSQVIIQGYESSANSETGLFINDVDATFEMNGAFTVRNGGVLKNAGLITIDGQILYASAPVKIILTAADAEVDIISLSAEYNGSLVIDDSAITQVKKAGDLFSDDVANYNSVTVTPRFIDNATSANKKMFTVEGLIVKSVIVKNDFISAEETHAYIKNLDVSGNVISSDISETAVENRIINDHGVSIALKGFNTISGDLNVGKYITVTTTDVDVVVHTPDSVATTTNSLGLFITGNITVVDGAKFGFLNDAATDTIFITGKITIENGTLQNLSTGDSLSAAYYKVAKTATTAELNVYTTFATAVADGATKITLSGLNYVAENISVPSGTTVENNGVVYIEEDAKVDFAQGSVLKNVGMMIGSESYGFVVDGVLYIADVKGTLKSGTDKIVSEVTINGEADRTYCGLAYALANADEGDTVKLSGTVTVDKDLIIPAGVTLETAGQAVNVTKNATLTVDGTLFISEGSVVAVENTGVETPDKVGKIVVNGVVKSENVISDALMISGAYYTIEGKTDYNYVEPVENAVGKIADAVADVNDYNMVVKNFEDAAMKVSDITVTGKTIDEPVTLAFVLGDVEIKSITLDNATVTFAAIDVNAVITNSVGTATVNGVSAGFAIGSTTIDDVKTLVIAGAFDEFLTTDDRTYAFTVSGTASLNTCNIDKIVVDGTLNIMTDSAAEKAVIGKLVVNGIFNVPSATYVSITEAEVYGTFAVAELTTEAAAGVATVTELYVGISEKKVIAASASVTGPVSVGDYAVVAAGSSVPENFADEKNTQFFVEDALYVTVYDFETNNTDINDIKASVSNAAFVQWNDADGKKILDGVKIGNTEKVTALINYEIYGVKIVVCDGIGSVSIDGNLIDPTFYADYTYLKAGTHTIEYTVMNGYTGSATLAVNGSVLAGATCSISGMSFTLSGDFNSAQDVVTLQLTGIEKTGYVPDSPDTSDGMTITDYLLIVLVVLIIVMAIIVAMRMMRS